MGYFNIYGQYVEDSNELYHHGVLGQKKGVRNGPPYPLSAKAHSASEKKAGWRQSLNNASEAIKRHREKRAEAKVARAERRRAKVEEKNVRKLDRAEEEYLNEKSKRKKKRALKKVESLSRRVSSEELNRRIQRQETIERYRKAIGLASNKFNGKEQVGKVVEQGKKITGRALGEIGNKVLLPALTGYSAYKLEEALKKTDKGKNPEFMEEVMKNVNRGGGKKGK